MPGQLERGAVCPMCQIELVAIVDTSNTAGVTREYYHHAEIGYTKPKCQRFFSNHNEARQERWMLETHKATQ